LIQRCSAVLSVRSVKVKQCFWPAKNCACAFPGFGQGYDHHEKDIIISDRAVGPGGDNRSVGLQPSGHRQRDACHHQRTGDATVDQRALRLKRFKHHAGQRFARHFHYAPGRAH
jgi:hypothetical protein